MRSTLTALIFMALVAAPASAAKLKLKDGKQVSGTAQRYDSPSKTLYFRTDDGKDVQYTLDQLDARSSYLVNASLVPKNDAPKQLMVANFARDAGLYAHAARRYGETLKTDPSLKPTVDVEMAKLRRMAAEACMARAREAAEKKNYPEAEKWLTTIIDKLPEEPEAAEAAAIIARYYEKNRAEKIAAADAKASDALKKDAETGKKRFEDMTKKCSEALQATSRSKAEGLWQAALVDGKAVLAEIEKLRKKYKTEGVSVEADRYHKIVIDEMVEVHLHMASQKSVQSDYNGAQKCVNAALALDPESAAALAARVRIEEAASQGIGWR